MSRRVRSWRQVRKALRDNGVHVDSRGSEAKLWRKEPDGSITMYILQHECCRGPSAIVWATHLSNIKRRFGLTNKDLGF